ncbi:hypothetical protein MW344_004821, partial [Vibrio parahaemolyticus]|nr:hypothetical protein [Vibrio parahaemolyticus]
QNDYTNINLLKSEAVAKENPEVVDKIVNHMNEFKFNDHNDYGSELIKVCYENDFRPEYFLDDVKLETSTDKQMAIEDAINDYQIAEQMSFDIAMDEGWNNLIADDVCDIEKNAMKFNPVKTEGMQEYFDGKLIGDEVSLAFGGDFEPTYDNRFILNGVEVDYEPEPTPEEPQNEVEQVLEQEPEVDTPDVENDYIEAPETDSPEEEQPEQSNDEQIPVQDPEQDGENRLSVEQKAMADLEKKYRKDKNKYYDDSGLVMEINKGLTSNNVLISKVTADTLYDGLKAAEPKKLRYIEDTDANYESWKEALEQRIADGLSIDEISCGRKVPQRYKDILEELKNKQAHKLELGEDNDMEKVVEEPKAEKVELGGDVEEPEKPSNDKEEAELQQENDFGEPDQEPNQKPEFVQENTFDEPDQEPEFVQENDFGEPDQEPQPKQELDDTFDFEFDEDDLNFDEFETPKNEALENENKAEFGNDDEELLNDLKNEVGVEDKPDTPKNKSSQRLRR